MIEAFRENGLNSLESSAEMNHQRLETLLGTVFHGLNKRLPTATQINAEQSSGLLQNWLLAAYDGYIAAYVFFFFFNLIFSVLSVGLCVSVLLGYNFRMSWPKHLIFGPYVTLHDI